ncbi:phosphotransferase enzyme family protein [Actinospica sp.]|jgi:Ser/Thr protein kinase RdoA (MazF antagonist)|uniref:phosphotransferase enzyme family protein n=1 Tax=Actinospica sp. TaxID=1872142 RepID=UPI002C8A7551|nr:phosphotransferase [Actinospica sp.]HWG25344.1 phosphotransferase [Actinospica sp.]
MSASPHLVHGMGTEPADPDWPPLTLPELDALLAAFPEAGGAREVRWRSPRPLSAAALVRAARGADVFVKRHHISVRTRESLAEEHGFLRHLAANHAPVVRVLTEAGGESVGVSDDGAWTYEVHSVGEGEDVYRDAISWSPFHSLQHAHSAGRILAKLHDCARGYDAPNRSVVPLTGGFTIFGDQTDPLSAAEKFAAARPALAVYLERKADWRGALERWHLPFYERLQPQLRALPPLWTHNDLHASNLLWHGDEAASVIDFNLADRAYAVHDLALAIERNAIEWVELAGKGERAVHADAARALIAGYEEVRRLTDAERAALPELLPLCHVDFALSELDYFAGVTKNEANAELAYRYLIDHTFWFASEGGSAFLREIVSPRA